jgi:hypothetical protein
VIVRSSRHTTHHHRPAKIPTAVGFGGTFFDRSHHDDGWVSRRIISNLFALLLGMNMMNFMGVEEETKASTLDNNVVRNTYCSIGCYS